MNKINTEWIQKAWYSSNFITNLQLDNTSGHLSLRARTI